MQDELKRYSDRIRTDGRLPIQARVGVNTGEVVVRSITTGADRTEYVYCPAPRVLFFVWLKLLKRSASCHP